jgi:hypothetical protein
MAKDSCTLADCVAAMIQTRGKKVVMALVQLTRMLLPAAQE